MTTLPINVVGKTKDEAVKFLTENSVMFRIMREDQQVFAGLANFLPYRLSIEIDNGIVTSQSNG